MNLQEYKETYRSRYERFSDVVRDILLVVIEKDPSHFNLQQIQTRAKTVSSLERKLLKKGIENSEEIQKKIKDLAGCRVIFYYNVDVNSFLGTGMLRDNFIIHWDESRVHYPTKDSESVNDQYTATHYVIELNEDRTSLPEYQDFRGMRCEIQVQTVLDHAWSETVHDITYKKSDSVGFGSRISQTIEKRLRQIMIEYLRPAGYEFKNVFLDHQRLLEGKRLLDREIIDEIRSDINNNERFEILQRFRDYVLPNYDDFANEIESIVELTQVAVSESKKYEVTSIETPSGALAGTTAKEILYVCLDILNFVRYVDVILLFDVLARFYIGATDSEERHKICEHGRNLAAYNLDIWKKAGPYVQSILISRMAELGDESFQALAQFMVTICDCALNPEIEGTSWDYQSVTFTTGPVSPSDEIKSIRKRSLDLLEKLYGYASSNSEKTTILATMGQASSTYRGVEPEDDVTGMISENTMQVLRFFKKIIPSEPLQIIEKIEHDAYWRYFHSSSDSVRDMALQVRDTLDAHKEYNIFKVLVGFEGIQRKWEDEYVSDDHAQDEKLRQQKAKEFAERITPDNFDEWRDRIVAYARTESDDLATFSNFGVFLEHFAEVSPDLAFRLIKENTDILDRFFVALFVGLWHSDLQGKARALIIKWVASGRHLYQAARLFEYIKDIDEELLTTILGRSKTAQDTETLIAITAAIAANYHGSQKPLIDRFFLPAIKELTLHKDTRWINAIYYRKNLREILSGFDEAGMDTILENLVYAGSIENHAQRILFCVAQRFPEKVIEFFGKRVKRQAEGDLGPRFSAIPYKFWKLQEPLSSIPDKAVEIVSGWYDGDLSMFVYRGAQLLKIIFPDFPKPFEEKLIELVRTGEEESIEIVLAVLRNYKGEPFLHNICRELINKLPEGHRLLDDVNIVLESLGAVRGDFGRVEALERKKEEVAYWLDDENEKVRNFAEQYHSSLDRRIASERRRAEEGLELRKHEYGVREE